MGVEYIFLGLLIAVYFASLHKIFAKAGIESWKGFVPGYNFFVWIKMLKKPWWWILLLLAPGVNLLVLMILNVLTSRAFGLRSTKDHFMAALLPWYTLSIIAYKEEHQWIGPIVYDKKKNKKTRTHEWFDAVLFAIIAATIIRTFLIEAFTIPTPSMEGSMLVGDYLFVSKVSYGPKMPNTPISFPFVHHTIPGLNVKSYVNWFSGPYRRLPGFGDVERGDVVVFNFPEGDTVIKDPDLESRSYHSMIRSEAWQRYLQSDIQNKSIEDFEQQYDKFASSARNFFHGNYDLVVRPVDKRENYIKRCVGIAGDSLEIRDKTIFINGQAQTAPEEVQFDYNIEWTRLIHDAQTLKEYCGIPISDYSNAQLRQQHGGGAFVLPLSETKKAKLEALGGVNITPHENSLDASGMPDDRSGRYFPIFPNDPDYKWTVDDYGPIWIPKAGATVSLTEESLPIYERIIDIYEGHDLEVKADGIYIDGAKTDQYTFEMDYFFLMGDNRHNSQDSRYWGFVPEDHVVGKAVFIWFSSDPESGVRWDRVFSGVD